VALARSAAPRLAPTLQAGNWASQPEQFISQLVSALPLYLRAYLMMNGKLTLGELIAFEKVPGTRSLLTPVAAG
jgi:ABC-type bacteriocin/lantibiotic exporter with double-glycine peptidase domain